MGIFDWSKKKPEPTHGNVPPLSGPVNTEPANVPMEGKSNTTSVERPEFSMVLPFRWISVPCNEGYEFRNQVLPEQLIVTVLQAKRALEMTELQAAVEFIVAARVQAATKLSQGRAILTKPAYSKSDTECEARAYGTDAPNKVKFAFAIRGTPEKIVTAALTRYTLEDIPPMEVHAGLIFDFLKVKTT